MKAKYWAAATLVACPLAANAFETRLNGFISVGAGATLQSDQTYVTDPINYGQYENEVSIKPDTMVAIQSLSKVNDRLSATAQLVGFANSDFDVDFEWAYVNYQLFSSVDLKFGRIRTPFFYYSSSLDLGYSYAWVRPPVEVYNVFLTSLEGISVDYEFSLGNWYGTATGFYGETDGTDPESGSYVTFDSMLGGVLQLENGNFTLRGSHTVDEDVTLNRFNVYSDPTADAMDDGLFNGTAGFNDITLDLPMTFTSASMIYDNGTLLLNGEYTLTRFTDNTNNDEVAWYGTLGYRVGSFTPHVTYASFKQLDNSENNAAAPGGAAPVVVAIADYPQELTAFTTGIRWDFDIAAALKLEYTIRNDKTVEPTGFEGRWSPFGDAQAISVAVDVVF